MSGRPAAAIRCSKWYPSAAVAERQADTYRARGTNWKELSVMSFQIRRRRTIARSALECSRLFSTSQEKLRGLGLWSPDAVWLGVWVPFAEDAAQCYCWNRPKISWASNAHRQYVAFAELNCCRMCRAVALARPCFAPILADTALEKCRTPIRRSATPPLKRDPKSLPPENLAWSS